VGVDPTKWSVDPFGAVIREGYLYGRGSIDDKAMLAANLAIVVALKRTGVRRARRHFLATATRNKAARPASRSSSRNIGTRSPALMP